MARIETLWFGIETCISPEHEALMAGMDMGCDAAVVAVSYLFGEHDGNLHVSEETKRLALLIRKRCPWIDELQALQPESK